MTKREGPPVLTSRRTLLSAFAGTGVGATLASVGGDRVAADSNDVGLVDADLLDAVSLGTFESDLDGWEFDGEIELSRVARSDRPVAVTEGQYALEASVSGDASPTIARPVGTLSLADRPHFVADVAPGRVEGTDAPVAFRFRLYRPADSLGESTDSLGESTDSLGESTDSLDGNTADLLDPDLELVAESDPVTVRQAAPGRIFWDASDVADGLLDAASRLEVGWWLAEDESTSDPDSASGDATDDFAYRGTVVFDDVRATATVDPVGSARIAAVMRELQFDHGPYQRTEVLARSETGEEGELVFADGATEPYRFEVLGDDRFRLTLADTEVKLGSRWS